MDALLRRWGFVVRRYYPCAREKLTGGFVQNRWRPSENATMVVSRVIDLARFEQLCGQMERG